MTRAGAVLWREAQGLARAAAAVSPRAVGLPPLLFFTDPQRTPQPWRTAAALPAGAAVVYRPFGAPEAERVAAQLRAATADRGVRLLIGLDAELAERSGADGVHLPERAVGQAGELRARRPDWLVTAAAHSADALTATAAAGASAAVLSPVFAPGGASRGPALGVEAFSRLAAAARLPVYALGGVTADVTAQLRATGACGLAAVDGIVAAFGPSD